MIGRAESYDRVPHFASDQYDLRIEYLGHALYWDRVVFRGDPESGSFVAFWIAGDRVLAGMSANIPGLRDGIEALVKSRRPVAVDELADPELPLDQLTERNRHDEVAASLR